MVLIHRWHCRNHANYYMSKLHFDKYALLSRKGFCWEYALLSQNWYRCKYAPFWFVWCRLLCRHLGFDLDFVQISGLKIGGWQHCHLLAFLLCRRCNSPSSWCLSRRQPCPPYSPSRLWPLLRSHQVPLNPWFPLNTHFSDCEVKWNDHPAKWMFYWPPSAVA